MSRLVQLKNNKQVAEINLGTQEISFGKDEGNTIRLETPGIAGRQAFIKRIGNEYILTDASGNNSTLLNDEPIITERLQHNDIIKMAQFTYQVELDEFQQMLDALSSSLKDGKDVDDFSVTFSTAQKGCKPVHVSSDERFKDIQVAVDESEGIPWWIWAVVGLVIVILLLAINFSI